MRKIPSKTILRGESDHDINKNMYLKKKNHNLRLFKTKFFNGFGTFKTRFQHCHADFVNINNGNEKPRLLIFIFK